MGGDHIIEAGFLRGDATGVEVSLNLGEPDLWVSWPECWQLDADCSNG